MNRKEFISISGMSIVVLTTPILYQCLGEDRKLKAIAYPDSLNEIWHEETIKIVGSKYLKKNPEENNISKLSNLILDNFNNMLGDLDKIIGNKISTDFLDGNLFIIDGWLLSITEARQCGLYFLIKS